MSVFILIREAIVNAFKDLYHAELNASLIQLEETNSDFSGDITVIVFPLLKISKKNPVQTANEIGEYLFKNTRLIVNYEVVKGFLNLMISESYYIKWLQSMAFHKGIKIQKSDDPIRYLIEYSSPNTNKPLHLGHIRNNLIGHSVAELLKIRGHEVIKVNLVNDRGIHICKSMLAFMKDDKKKTPENTGIKGDHLVGNYYVEFDRLLKEELHLLKQKNEHFDASDTKLMQEARKLLIDWENNENQTRLLWKTMNSWVYDGFEQTYKRLGISFDKTYYESNTYLLGKDIVSEGLKMNVFYQKEDGSVWIDLTDEGYDEKALLRSDGTSVYITQDLGTAQLRYDDFKPDKAIYVVGNEQDYHFAILKAICRKMGKPYADSLFHLSYGMVDLPEGKMKSREGTVVDADDLMNEMVETAFKYIEESGKLREFSETEIKNLCEKVGLAALKFFILKTDAKKRMVFNPKESIDFQGFTGPFVQYTFARIQSVFRKGNISNPFNCQLNEVVEMTADEKAIIKKLYFSNEVLELSENRLDPSAIAIFMYQLAKLYNKFYHEHPILNEENTDKKALRICLSALTANILETFAGILGMSMPERM